MLNSVSSFLGKDQKQRSQFSTIISTQPFCYWKEYSEERLSFFLPDAFVLQLVIDTYKAKQLEIKRDIFDGKEIRARFEKLVVQSKEIKKYLEETGIPQLSKIIGGIEAELVGMGNSK